jgi:ABC-2 type transport system permease protein
MAKQPAENPEQAPSDPAHGAIAVRSHSAAGHNNLRNIRLIIGREYRNRLTQRSFIITTIVLLVIVFIAPFVPTIIQLVQSRTAGAPAQTQVVVVDNAGGIAGMSETALASYISAQLNGTTSPAPYAISSQPPTALDGLQSQVKQGKLDILLVMNRSLQDNLQFVYTTDGDPTTDGNLTSFQTLAQYLTVLDTAQRLGLTPAQTARLFAPASLTTVYAQQGQPARPVNQVVADYLLAVVGAILIYVTIGLYGGIVAAGVAEEKSSRVMEILVNAATPFQLLAGKIVGIGTACLTQMGSMVVVGIGSVLLQIPLQTALFGANAGGFSQYLASVSIQFFLLFLVYILLAFFLYATLYAGLSALVKRQDEVQNATIVPSMLILSGYLLFYVAVSAPDSTLKKVLSYIPFWTPSLMLARLARGTVAGWEIAATIGLMLAAILACTWFAARLYRIGVLMYGQRPSLGQALKLARMN